MKTIEQLGISPTPWNQGDWDPYREDNIVWCGYKSKDGNPIHSTRVVARCVAIAGTDQSRIDARLIAAAPDLYEALRECLEVLDEVEECFQEVDEETSKMMGKARAALEKAGGGE